MKKFFAIVALMAATLTVSAQDYNWAAGVRFGGFSGLTAKKTLGTNALEFGASWGLGGYLTVDALYEWTTPVINDDFHLYYGAGAFLGTAANSFALGVEGVVGLEYRLPINFPLAISLDYRPGVLFAPIVYPLWGNLSLGVKYCF